MKSNLFPVFVNGDDIYVSALHSGHSAEYTRDEVICVYAC